MFGIPGEENIRLVVATADSKIRFILTRHAGRRIHGGRLRPHHRQGRGLHGDARAWSHQPRAWRGRRPDGFDAARGHHGAGGRQQNLQGVAPDCGCPFHVQAALQVGRHSADSSRGAGNGPQGVRCRAIGAPRRRVSGDPGGYRRASGSRPSQAASRTAQACRRRRPGAGQGCSASDPKRKAADHSGGPRRCSRPRRQGAHAILRGDGDSGRHQPSWGRA